RRNFCPSSRWPRKWRQRSVSASVICRRSFFANSICFKASPSPQPLSREGKGAQETTSLGIRFVLKASPSLQPLSREGRGAQETASLRTRFVSRLPPLPNPSPARGKGLKNLTGLRPSDFARPFRLVFYSPRPSRERGWGRGGGAQRLQMASNTASLRKRRWRPNPWCNRERYRMLPLVSGLKVQLATAGKLTLGLSPTVARV